MGEEVTVTSTLCTPGEQDTQRGKLETGHNLLEVPLGPAVTCKCQLSSVTPLTAYTLPAQQLSAAGGDLGVTCELSCMLDICITIHNRSQISDEVATK